jgi:spermidine/putrescine transport system substrate-binding protein
MRSFALAAVLFAAISPNAFSAIAKSEAAKLANDGVNTTLRIYNWSDYIGENVISEFKDYVKEHDQVDLTVVYDTFDTNESMLSQLETGSADYDLICPSDYMIQRMMANGLLIPFASGSDRAALYGTRNDPGVWEDNYALYAYKYLQNVFAGITAPVGGSGAIGSLEDYARGYMWGTLGILYNPGFYKYSERGLTPDEIKFAMNDWGSLWDDAYKGTFQIKDSMRDTYSVGLMKTYDSYFAKLLAAYRSGSLGEKEYHDDVTTIFNNIEASRLDDFNALAKTLDPAAEDETADLIIDRIQDQLTTLRDNAYGLEVDSGKTDITDGKMSGIDLAWSGDAVYSMDTADDLGNTLYYSIPENGGNIWFDGWVLPTTCANQEYAQKFIDFISDPAIAAENMDYIGYTPFIAGDEILRTVREYYDPRMSYLYAYDETADDFYRDENGDLVPFDGTGEQEVAINGEDATHTVDFGSYDLSALSEEQLNDLYNHCGTLGETYSSWEDFCARNELSWTKVNLTYFFDGSFGADSLFQDGIDDWFYSSEIEHVTGLRKDGTEETIQVGRQFFAQYPPEELIPSLAVMEDYGDNNSYVLRMWEAVKSGSIPLWVIIVLLIEILVALIVGLYFFIRHSIAKSLRKKRRLDKAKQNN